MNRSRIPALTLALVLVFFYLPILVLVVNSFNVSRFGGTWEGFTFHWYETLFRERAVWLALRNSLLVALGATVLSMVLGTSAALALHRYRSRLQQMHYALVYTPLVVPDILMGMSLLLFFVATGLELGLFTVFLAHVTFCISYVTMVVLARLQDFDESVLEASQDLGANWWQTATRVLLPLLAPGIVAGGLLAFTLSIDDFVITFFVAGPGSTTLPVRIYSMIKHSRNMPMINALSTILLVVTCVTVWVSQTVTQKEKT
jgi:spermidine/putrescine transport system permease protein